jgi:hypothetical protein
MTKHTSRNVWLIYYYKVLINKVSQIFWKHSKTIHLVSFKLRKRKIPFLEPLHCETLDSNKHTKPKPIMPSTSFEHRYLIHGIHSTSVQTAWRKLKHFTSFNKDSLYSVPRSSFTSHCTVQLSTSSTDAAFNPTAHTYIHRVLLWCIEPRNDDLLSQKMSWRHCSYVLLGTALKIYHVPHETG